MWYDICRKVYDSPESARSDMSRAIDVINRTIDSVLQRKLADHEITSPLKTDYIHFVEVIEDSALKGKTYIEVRKSCSLRKI